MLIDGFTLTFDEDIKNMLYINISSNTNENITTTPHQTLNSDKGTLETLLVFANNTVCKVFVYKITNVKVGDSIKVVKANEATGCRHLFIKIN